MAIAQHISKEPEIITDREQNLMMKNGRKQPKNNNR